MKATKYIPIAGALLALVALGQPALAFQEFPISCEGTESTGGGTYRYQYTLVNTGVFPEALTSFCVGTGDPNPANYTFVPTPGLTPSVLPNDGMACAIMVAFDKKVPHGSIPSGSPINARAVIHWSGNLTVPPGGTVTFAYDHPASSWTYEWIALHLPGVRSFGLMDSAVAGPTGVYTYGYVHAPDTATCLCPHQDDYDEDGFITALDLSALIGVLFEGAPQIQDPQCPSPRGDDDCDGYTTALDLAYKIDHLFAGGPPPRDPCGPIGRLLESVGCKDFPAHSATADVPPDQDCIEYEYDGTSVLRFKHINAGFNCCPDSFSADFHFEDGNIAIDEIEWLSNPCYCLCLFDLDYEIVGLPPGEYTIRVNEPYVEEGEQVLEFTVDLISSPSGIHCVTRNNYPWGIP